MSNGRIALFYICFTSACFNLLIYVLTEARPYCMYYMLYFLLINIICTYSGKRKDDIILVLINIIFINTFHFSIIYSSILIISSFFVSFATKEYINKKLTIIITLSSIIGALPNAYVVIIQYSNSYNKYLHAKSMMINEFKDNFNSLYSFHFLNYHNFL